MSAGDTPAVPFHPPIIPATALVVAWLLDRAVALPIAAPALRTPRLAVSVLAFLAGGALALWAVAVFRRARTGIPVHHPVTALVTSGPYLRSRNPIYLGMMLAYAGIGGMMDWMWAILLLPAVVIAMNVLVIAREEIFLAAKFGDAYRDYARRVRRWL